MDHDRQLQLRAEFANKGLIGIRFVPAKAVVAMSHDQGGGNASVVPILIADRSGLVRPEFREQSDQRDAVRAPAASH
jgi:hypothetical protein